LPSTDAHQQAYWRNHNNYHLVETIPIRYSPAPGTEEVDVLMKIKCYKPAISMTIKPFRTVRRLHLNPTYLPIGIGPALNILILGALSATSTMSGLTLGVCLRVVGL
jgi:hypothetical protein